MIFFKRVVSVSGLTLASRILGMFRDILIAGVFGASLASDAFFIVFRPFDLARKMMSEGILTLSFIPVFSRVSRKAGKAQSVSLFWSAGFWVFILAAVTTVVGVCFAPQIIGLLAPGYVPGSQGYTLAVQLFKVMLPYMGAIFLAALSMGVLNCLGKFLVPAVTPVILNVMVIAGALFFTDLFSSPVIILAVAVTMGGMIQLGFQIPWLCQNGMLDIKRFVFVHPGVIETVKKLVPSVVGAASFQINMLVAGLLATLLVPGSVSYLYYAERLVQFPLALLASSVATVLLPVMSDKAARVKAGTGLDGIRTVFDKGVTLVFFFTIPAMAGIMALHLPIVELLFGRGAFDAVAVARTGDCLFWLTTGLWAMAGTRLFTTFHFSMANVRLPFFSGLVAIGVNGVTGMALGHAFGVAGLAFAVALSSMAGFFFLVLYSRAQIDIRSLVVCACRALFISGIMALLVRWVWAGWTSWMPGTEIVRWAGLMISVVAGALFFFTAATLFAGREINMIKTVVFDKV